MINKCKFEVDITYNSDFFSEGELRETVRSAIRDLNDAKEKMFGRVMHNPGKMNSGVSCDVTRLVEHPDETSHVVETLVGLSNCMAEDDEPNIVLPDHKLEELMAEVRTVFNKT